MNTNHFATAPRVLLAAYCLAPVVAAAAPAPAKRPNVVLILIDDMGWRDCGYAGNAFIETPAIDALARDGMRFTRAYASAPNCSPTRACLMSGLYTPRHGVYTVTDPHQAAGSPWQKLASAESREEMPSEIVTVAETLRDGGYTTGMVGMWNLGRGRSGPCTPTGQGFGSYAEAKALGFEKDAYARPDGRRLGDAFTDAAVSFIKAAGDQPFFLYYAPHAVHAPFDPSPSLLKKYREKASKYPNDPAADPMYAATVEELDANVARVRAALRESGHDKDTLIVLTSDNGATRPFCLPLRGSKGELYERGIRVPLVVVAPGVARPGSMSEAVVSSVDFHATLAEWCGVKAPAGLDGRSLLPLLRGEAWPERPVFWHFPCYIGGAKPGSAMSRGDWKILEFFEDKRVELYNLARDPAESTNLATREPARAKAMLEELRAWRKSTGAAVPSAPNPAYDPKATRPKGERGRK